MDKLDLPARCLVCWKALENLDQIPYCEACWRQERAKVVLDVRDTYGAPGRITAAYLSGRALEARWHDFLIEEIYSSASFVAPMKVFDDSSTEPYYLLNPDDILRAWDLPPQPTWDQASLLLAVARLRIYHRTRRGYLEGRASPRFDRALWTLNGLIRDRLDEDLMYIDKQLKPWRSILRIPEKRGRKKKTPQQRTQESVEFFRKVEAHRAYLIQDASSDESKKPDSMPKLAESMGYSEREFRRRKNRLRPYLPDGEDQ